MSKVIKDLRNLLEENGFNFEDGLLGGVGSGGGGYYDWISDKIVGFNFDKWDEKEFNNWVDNFNKKSFNYNSYNINDEYDDESLGEIINFKEIIKVGVGIYKCGYGGYVEIRENGEIIIYAVPLLCDKDDDKLGYDEGLKEIFEIDSEGNVKLLIDKNELRDKMKSGDYLI